MKKLLGMIIVLGFVIMVGAAGSADSGNIGFALLVMLELLGVVVVLLGTSLLLNYKRYLRRRLRKLSRTAGLTKNMHIASKSANLHKRQRELC